MWKEMHVLDQLELQQDLQALTALLHRTGALLMHKSTLQELLQLQVCKVALPQDAKEAVKR